MRVDSRMDFLMGLVLFTIRTVRVKLIVGTWVLILIFFDTLTDRFV